MHLALGGNGYASQRRRELDQDTHSSTQCLIGTYTIRCLHKFNPEKWLSVGSLGLSFFQTGGDD